MQLRSRSASSKTSSLTPTPTQTQNTDLPPAFHTKKQVVIYFDGACNDNGSINAKTACAVFVEEYNNGFSKSFLLKEAETNNQAEIKGAFYALKTVGEISKQFQIKDFIIRGDSEHVINSVKEGKLRTIDQRSKIKNNSFWYALKKQLEDTPDVTIEWQWIPRHLNQEADELAKACLQEREPNTNVRSAATNTKRLERNVLGDIVTILSRRRNRTLNCIPGSLTHLFNSFIFSLLSDESKTMAERRIIFILSPHLISIDCCTIKNNDNYKNLRSHLILLQQSAYLNHSLTRLYESLQTPIPTPKFRESTEEDHKNRINTLCKRGLFHKCFESETLPADYTEENKEKLVSLFPQDTLHTPTPVIFSEIQEAAKKLKRGKSSGLSGWTAELLTPMLFGTPPLAQRTLTQIFTDITNNHEISAEERNLFQTGVLSPLKYKSQPSKIRPVILIDTIIKISWHIVFINLKDPNRDKSSHTFGHKGSAQLSLFTIQRALQMEEIVICMDAENAYNTVKRHAAFEYLQKYQHDFHRVFPLVNLMYSQQTQCIWFQNGSPFFTINITTGTRQGCVSGLWFYTPWKQTFVFLRTSPKQQTTFISSKTPRTNTKKSSKNSQK